MNIYLIIIAVLFALDAWSTIYILRHGYEMNKIMQHIFKRFGAKEGLLITKGGLLVIISYYQHLLPLTFWYFVIAVYVAVVSWNLRQVYIIHTSLNKE